jgi:hypothetical protein
MKTNILSLTIGMFAIGALLFSSCQKEQELATPNGQKITITETGTSCTPIYAGQNILVGEVCLEDVDTNNDDVNDAIRVTYNVTSPWLLYEIHFDAGGATSCIPMTKKGNLIPGQFDFKFSNLGGVSTFTFDVPFNSTCLDYTCGQNSVLHAAAHCVVGQSGTSATETGWGNGSNVPGNSWGSVFSFSIDCDENNDVPDGCETAFAYGNSSATCFLSIDDPCDNPNNAFSRWGWTNGPYAEGIYTMPIYAAAGQCDLSKGTNVGTLTVDYSGGNVTVSYEINAPYNLDEVHVYVGNSLLAGPSCEWTVAPGQYPVVDEDASGNSYSTTFTGISGSIYVVAHSVVCGF